MKLVLDASMALAWRIERIDAVERDCAQRLKAALAQMEVFVPFIWHLEVTNGLLVGERHGRVTQAQSEAFLRLLDRLPITTDDVLISALKVQALTRARICGLTAYDATYLDLAFQTGACLATFDRKLATAMRAAGGAVFA